MSRRFNSLLCELVGLRPDLTTSLAVFAEPDGTTTVDATFYVLDDADLIDLQQEPRQRRFRLVAHEDEPQPLDLEQLTQDAEWRLANFIEASARRHEEEMAEGFEAAGMRLLLLQAVNDFERLYNLQRLCGLRIQPGALKWIDPCTHGRTT